MLRIDLGFPDDSSMTVWRKLGCSSRVVVAVCLPALTLYYTSDIGASLLLFAITYAFQSTHSHTVVFMREVICTAIGLHAVSLILYAQYSPEFDHKPKVIGLGYRIWSIHHLLHSRETRDGGNTRPFAPGRRPYVPLVCNPGRYYPTHFHHLHISPTRFHKPRQQRARLARRPNNHIGGPCPTPNPGPKNKMAIREPLHRRRHPLLPPIHLRMPVLYLHTPRVAPHQLGYHGPPSAWLALRFWAGCSVRAYILRPRLRIACCAAKSGYGGSGAWGGGNDVDICGAVAISRVQDSEAR